MTRSITWYAVGSGSSASTCAARWRDELFRRLQDRRALAIEHVVVPRQVALGEVLAGSVLDPDVEARRAGRDRERAEIADLDDAIGRDVDDALVLCRARAGDLPHHL